MISRYASLRQGLVGAWCPSVQRCGSGFTLPDLSGYGNNGSLVNMDPGTDWVPSESGLALDFDGSNDGIRISSSSYANTQGTVVFWMRSSLDSVKAALTFQDVANFDNLFAIYIGDGATGTLSNELITIGRIKAGVSNISAFLTTDRNQLLDNKWHHVSVSSNGSAYSIYIDGVSKTVTLGGTNGVWMDVNSATTLGIGCRFANTNSPNLSFQGQLDDIRIHNRVLTRSEIQLLYTGGRGVGLAPERIKHRRKTTAAAFKAAWARRQQHIGSGVY